MSELANTGKKRSDFRHRLLTTVSALALIGTVFGAHGASAESDTDRPTIWVELGGQLEQQTGQGDVFSPSFVADNSDSPAYRPGSPLSAEKPPLFSNGLDGKVTFEPGGTNWVFSAAVRYGRSTGHKSFSQNQTITHQAHFTSILFFPSTHLSYRTRTQRAILFAGAQVTQEQSHAVVDFAAGKDVGLGMFGKGGVSQFNIGVRFAQFVSRSSGAIQARPNAKFITYYTPTLYYYYHTRFPQAKFRRNGQGAHTYAGKFKSQRNFHGIGPALSWNASVPVLGGPQAGTLNVDWGANAAVLFGRQRAGGSHQTSVNYKVFTAPVPQTHHTSVGGFNRSRAVVVPNVGGFAGVSFNFTNAKVALGYRGDFFFGAMDAGNDTRKTKTVGFYGPFASVSIGIGG